MGKPAQCSCPHAAALRLLGRGWQTSAQSIRSTEGSLKLRGLPAPPHLSLLELHEAACCPSSN